MRITGVRTVRAELPLEEPVTTAIHRIARLSTVIVRVDTDEGIAGESYLWAMGGRRAAVLQSMVRALAPVALGRDPRDTQGLWSALWKDINFLGHRGVTLFGISALDWACWDILGRSLGVSVGRLLGRTRDRVPAYASGGLWLGMSVEALQAQAREFVAAGFRAVKMRLGKPDPAEDEERVAAVREAIGPHVALMADANQGFTFAHALRLGRALEPWQLAWLEEPLPAWDLRGSARLAATLDTPIASGETEYTLRGMREMLELGAADILMPDLERVGGVTEFIKVARLAEAWERELSPHVFTEHSLQLCAAIPNLSWTEHMPWFGALFEETLELDEDGTLPIPDRPGFGFTLREEAVQRFAVAGTQTLDA